MHEGWAIKDATEDMTEINGRRTYAKTIKKTAKRWGGSAAGVCEMTVNSVRWGCDR